MNTLPNLSSPAPRMSCHPEERAFCATKDLSRSSSRNFPATRALPALALVFFFLLAFSASAQQPAVASSAKTQKSVEAFLRNYFALGPEFTITVGTPKPIGSSGLSEVSVDVKSQDGSDNVKMYLTADGRYLIRGEVSDLTADPLAENTAKFDLKGAPVLGDPKAPITIVEYGDFECPVCRNFHDAVRGLLPKYPQAKLVFKDFPLDSIHPWARTAALAGRCAYQQDPKAFWKMYDLIYDNQDLISAANAYDKMRDFATRAGLNADTFKSCLSSPQVTAEIDASIENGKLVNVRSTPTVFVNGRPLSGADPHALQQYLDFETAKLASTKK
ncbi:MAG: thioredoxin domain-containing protein [Candidatus Acidiferrum sp.]